MIFFQTFDFQLSLIFVDLISSFFRGNGSFPPILPRFIHSSDSSRQKFLLIIPQNSNLSLMIFQFILISFYFRHHFPLLLCMYHSLILSHFLEVINLSPIKSYFFFFQLQLSTSHSQLLHFSSCVVLHILVIFSSLLQLHFQFFCSFPSFVHILHIVHIFFSQFFVLIVKTLYGLFHSVNSMNIGVDNFLFFYNSQSLFFDRFVDFYFVKMKVIFELLLIFTNFSVNVPFSNS